MSIHGNSFQNQSPHHLYAIYDLEENTIFKYGISDKPIGINSYSKRMSEQVDYLNRAVGWSRYFATVLIRDIDGREKALDIETHHIDNYRLEFGRNPRGNL